MSGAEGCSLVQGKRARGWSEVNWVNTRQGGLLETEASGSEQGQVRQDTAGESCMQNDNEENNLEECDCDSLADEESRCG